MKSLFKKLPIVAFVFAIATAFAFDAPVKEELQLVWFQLDSFGNVGAEMDPSGICDIGNTFCAVGIDINDLDEFGDPKFTNVTHPDASGNYDSIVRRD